MSALRAYSTVLRQPAGLQATADQLVEEEIRNDVPAAEGCHRHCHTDELLSHMMTLEDYSTSRLRQLVPRNKLFN